MTVLSHGRLTAAPLPPDQPPYTLLSCCVSLDGYLDDASQDRLLLSNDADFDRVDKVRASCDAILVGAGTMRRDNPRLLVRSPARQAERVATGRLASPVKVTVTNSGDVDPAARFFTDGDGPKLVYCPPAALSRVRRRLGAAATVVSVGEPVNLRRLLADLRGRGVDRLMVEGGGLTHTRFLTADLVDELQLVVAPLFIGDSAAPRFVHDGGFPWGRDRQAVLSQVQQLGNVVLLRYALSDRFDRGAVAA